MRKTILLLALLFALTANITLAQQFEIFPDSTEGQGAPDVLNKFEGAFNNLWDQENRVAWTMQPDLPDGWGVEICQLSYNCWPEWIQADTMVLPPNAEDTLQVKFYTSAENGTGSVTIHFHAVEDPQMAMEFTFILHVGPDGVSEQRQHLGTGLKFNLGYAFQENSSAQLILPGASKVRAAIYDIQGREVAVIINDFLPKGENSFVMPRSLSQQTGVYFINVSTERFGSLTRKVTYFH